MSSLFSFHKKILGKRVPMFYSFANLYAWFNRCWILISVFCIQSVAICCLVKAHEENPASHSYVVGKKGNI